MSSTEDLQNELEVSKRVIRVLTKDLLDAEKKIKALEVGDRDLRRLHDTKE